MARQDISLVANDEMDPKILKQQLEENGPEKFFDVTSLDKIQAILRCYPEERDDDILPLYTACAQFFLQQYINAINKKNDITLFPIDIYQIALGIFQRVSQHGATQEIKIDELAQLALAILETHLDSKITWLSVQHIAILKKIINDSIEKKAQKTDKEVLAEVTDFARRVARVLIWLDKNTGNVALPENMIGDFVRVSEYWLPQRLGFNTLQEFALSNHPCLMKFLNIEVYGNVLSREEDHHLIAIIVSLRIFLIPDISPGTCDLYFQILSAYSGQYRFYDFLFDDKSLFTQDTSVNFIETILSYAARYSLKTHRITFLCAKLYLESLRQYEKKTSGFIENTLQNGDERQRLLIVTTLGCGVKLTSQEIRLRDSIGNDHQFDCSVRIAKQKLGQSIYSPHCYEDPEFDQLITTENVNKASSLGQEIVMRAALFRLAQAKYGHTGYSAQQIKNCLDVVKKSRYGNTDDGMDITSFFEDKVVVDYSLEWAQRSGLVAVWNRVIKTEFLGDQNAFFRSEHPLLHHYRCSMGKTSREEDVLLKRMAQVRLQDYMVLCQCGRSKEADEKYSSTQREQLYALCNPVYYVDLNDYLDIEGSFDFLPQRFQQIRKKYKNFSDFCVHNQEISSELTFDRYQQGSFYARVCLFHIALARLYYTAFVKKDAFLEEQLTGYLDIVVSFSTSVEENDLIDPKTINFLKNFCYENGVAYSHEIFDDRYQRILEYSAFHVTPVGRLPDLDTIVGPLDMSCVSPKIRELILGGATLRSALDKLEHYVNGCQKALKKSILPINYPVPQNLKQLMYAALQYQEIIYSQTEEERFFRVISHLCPNGCYDDAFIIYEKSVNDWFDGVTQHQVVDKRWTLTGDFSRYPSIITSLLTVENYHNGGFNRRVLLLKACLKLVDIYPEKQELYQEIFDAAVQDEWFERFPTVVQAGLTKINPHTAFKSDISSSIPLGIFSQGKAPELNPFSDSEADYMNVEEAEEADDPDDFDNTVSSTRPES